MYILAKLLERYDDVDKLRQRMTEYYHQNLTELVGDGVQAGTREGRTAMANRIVPKFFSTIARRRDTTGTTKILTDLLKPRRVNNNTELVRRYAEDRRIDVNTVQHPGVLRTIPHHPELAVYPDAQVGADRALIFRECDATNVESYIKDSRSCPISIVDGYCQVKPGEDVWYVAAGIFEAFKDIRICEYVVCARDDLCIIEIWCRSLPIRSIREDMKGKLSRFYFEVLLPELAHPRRSMDYPLRDKPIEFDEETIDHIRRGRAPTEE